jgi:protein O-GlcNAc transferase
MSRPPKIPNRHPTAPSRLATQQLQVASLLDQGLILINQGKLNESIVLFEAILKIQPNHFDAIQLLGLVLAQLKQYPQAVALLTKAISINPYYADAHSNRGNVLQELQRLDEALVSYDKAISINPNHADAHSNRGITLQKLQRLDEALVSYDKAISINPNHVTFYSNRGNALQELHRLDEALVSYDKAISINPNYADAYSNRGNALKELQRLDEALASYDKAISINHGHADAYYNRGIVLQELQRLDEALASYDKAISINSNHAASYSNRGNALQELQRLDEALVSYDKAISINPNYADAYYNLGNALKELQRLDEALVSYDKAISINPNHADAHSNRGITLQKLQRLDEALVSYDKAISVNPNYADAYSNRGNALKELQRLGEALASYDKAISINPDHAASHSNRGTALHELHRFDEAITHFAKALSLKPASDWVSGQLLYTKMKICDWSNLANSIDDISKKVMANEKAVPPFALLAMNDHALLHKKSAEIFIQSEYPINSTLGPIPAYTKKEKIRVAYFSADFRNHAVAFLTAELFELHDRDKFEVFAFSLQKAPIRDEMNLRLRRGFDRYIDVDNMSDPEIALLARELEVDIAIDLTGLTQYSRPGIFSCRAAPIQVNWLGYPGTIGANFIDYIVADKNIIPESHQQFYTEKVVYLPDTYIVDDSKRVASSRQFTREEYGLPEDTFVFCCFNNDYKFNPQVLDSWSRILLGMEQSILWISENNESFKTGIKIEFKKRGIDSTRIIFAQRVELMADHLARYALADLFLDTHPYNAHTTAVDSLKAGVPVLTLKGQSFASRVAASLLNAIRLPELITNTQEEYEALAIELAMNPIKLAEIKLSLANNRLTTPLFDTPLFTKNLEAGYKRMMKRYWNNCLPEHIFI